MITYRVECLDATGSVYWSRNHDTRKEAITGANEIGSLGRIRIIEITTTEKTVKYIAA